MARQIFCTLLAAALLCVALPGVLSSQIGTSFQAYYDELGQLATVVYPNGDVIKYTYDAVGNILSISKTTLSSPGALAIFNVLPLRGVPGDSVTIQGQGFSTTPANDTLQFNGTAAIVTSATATTLVTTVPNAATTGPISVTVGGVTAQGPVFTVLPGLAIAPTNPSIPLGSSKQFTATNVFSDGTTQDVTTTVTWSSSNGAVATISNATGTQGLATSVAAGTTTITATSGVRTASTTLTVTPPVAVSLAVTPANFTVFSGLTIQFVAIATFTDGTTQDLTSSVSWSSSNTAVATISNTAGSQGLASALANGTTTIKAVSGALSDSTSLTVSSASQAVSRFAYVPGAGGTVSIYTVNPATGDLRPNGYVNNISGIFSGGLSSFIRVVAVDPTGRFVYVGNPASANISAYTLDPATAGLAPVPGSPFQGTNAEGRGISIHPTGKFLYDSSGGGPSVFSIDQGNGALTSLGSLLAGGTATSTTLHPSGKFLYVPVNANNPYSIVGYTVDPLTGMLTQFAGAPPSAGTNPFDVAVDPAGKFAYAVNFGSNNVSAYTIDPVSGALTQVTGSPFAAGNNPISATVDPLSKFLYVANSASFGGSPNVSAYTINSATGALVPVPGSPFAAGTSLVDVTVDPGGKFLYVVDQAGFVSIFSIDPTNGALAFLKFIEARPLPLAIAINKGTTPVTYTPKFAYVANSGSNNISAYTIDPGSGALTAVSGSPFPAGMQPGSISVHPNGKLAYAVNTVDQTISAYSIDPTTGALAQIGQPIAEGQVGAGAVMIDPSGQFLYVVNTNVQGSQGSVSAYQINSASGALTPITGSPFTAPFGAGINPVSMAIDPQGNSLLVANSGSNDVLGFQIAPLGGSKPAGALTAIGNPPAVPAGTKPVSVAVGPIVTSSFSVRGPVFYVANSGSGDISIYIFAGGVVQAGSTTVGPNPQALVVDLSGKFLYVAGGTSGSPSNVSAFSINPSTGALTAISGSSVPVGTGPLSMTLDFSGQFLYVTNSGSNNVSAFRINPTTGALTPVAGSPFPAGTAAKSVTTTGKIQ